MPDPVTAIVGGTIGSTAANIFGAQSGAKSAAEAAAKANAAAEAKLTQGLDLQKGYFDSTTKDLSELSGRGREVYDELVRQLPQLTADVTMDQDALERTPGYQFNVKQGIRGVDLSSATKGLSGAQAKAAAGFAVDLANNTYKDQWNIANQNKTNAFNRLLSTANVGADASKSFAAAGTSAGNQALSSATGTGKIQSENIVGAGKAQTAADIATGAQVGNALTTIGGVGANGDRINNTLTGYTPWGTGKATGMYGTGDAPQSGRDY